MENEINVNVETLVEDQPKGRGRGRSVLNTRGGEMKGKADYSLEKRNPELVRKKPSSYFNVNDLDIPEEVVNEFASMGFGLRYVRFIKPGSASELDYQNIGKRIQQGYTFVSIGECPALAQTSFKRDINVIGFDRGDFKDVIIKGDLALMKVPLENIAERNQELRQITRNAMDSVNMTARSSNLIDGSSSSSRLHTTRRQVNYNRD